EVIGTPPIEYEWRRGRFAFFPYAPPDSVLLPETGSRLRLEPGSTLTNGYYEVFVRQGSTTISTNFSVLVGAKSPHLIFLGGTTNSGYADGAGTNALFSSKITDIASDPLGNIYVADSGNYCVRKVSSTGNVTTIAGTNSPGTADGLGLE